MTTPQATQQNLTCPLCGLQGITTSWKPHSFNYGSGDSMVVLTVDVPVRLCTPCEFEYLDEQAEQLKHNAVCGHLDALTPDQILGIREDFGMTQDRCSRLTGITVTDLTRWESGLSIQTLAQDRFLRLLAANPGNMQQLERVADSGSGENIL